MLLFVAGADIAAVFFLLLILFSLRGKRERRDTITRNFIWSVTALIIAVVSDGASFIMDFYGGKAAILIVLNLLSYVGADIVGTLFVFYIWQIINSKVKTPIMYANVAAFVCGVDALFVLIGAFTGKFFTVRNGVTVYGPWKNYYGYLQMFVMIYVLVLVFKNRYIVGKKVVFSVSTYFVLPAIATVVELINPKIALAYLAFSLVHMIIYVAIESEELHEQTFRAKVMEDLLYSDQLTGAFNRKAYEDDILRLEREGLADDFVYVSVDVNGLKVANDSLGHEAGDQLLIGAAKCMQKAMNPYGKVYRIGGDEFVALITISKEKQEEMSRFFEEIVNGWRGSVIDTLSVSAGYVRKDECDNPTMKHLAAVADDLMYETKERYYRAKGVDRKGQKEAHAALQRLFTKILKINITDDTYQIANMIEAEMTEEMGFSHKISLWLRSFGESGNVHPEDLEHYYAMTDIEYLKSYFAAGNEALMFTYRRKTADDYERVLMDIITADDYSNENQSLYLYVKMIDVGQ